MGLEPAWSAIALRKQDERAAKNPPQWRLPECRIPQDPPRPEHGPQNVLGVPREFLTRDEVQITESYSVANLLSAMAQGKLTATQVTEAFCHRASLAHQLTNCLTEILFEPALQRARELDRYLAEHNGRPFGPLHGLPVSIKDTFDLAGVDSSIGIASLCFKPAGANSPLADLLLSLGCVIIAKTNVPQTLAALDSVNNVFGRTANPANRLCTAGGSSGGEGVLVAMGGSMVGIGTDIGGSIRIPAMCNGVYGFKPSVGRLPYGGQAKTAVDGVSRTTVQAVVGPIGRSVEDLEVFMRAAMPVAAYYGEDCLHFTPNPAAGLALSSAARPPTIGVLRSDGNCALLPPVSNVISEVSSLLRQRGVRVVELPTPRAWTRAQSVMSKLMFAGGSEVMASLLEATSEPLVPWMQGRFAEVSPKSLNQVAGLQAQRAGSERELMGLWYHVGGDGQRSRRFDAIVCPVAAHPVPGIDRWNAVGYTSSFVLLDYPAGTVPVRNVVESDLELGRPLAGPVLSSWDERCRELWDEESVDRKMYLGTPLSVQVVVPRLEEERLLGAMKLVNEVIRNSGISSKPKL